jgi:predicted O-linked N-acetylglucosamine transferase (SPINDLY family)
MTATAPTTLTHALQQARALSQEQRWREAAPHYREAHNLAPTNSEALEGLGLVALHSGAAEEALSWFERALRHCPPNASLLGLLGVAQKRTGDLDSAITTFNEALRLEPKNYAVAVNLARTFRERGNLAEAIVWFERALELEPRATDGHSMLSNALREAGRLEEALEAAKRALDLDPRHAEAHLNLGAALHASGRFDDAAASYLIAQLLTPRDARVSSNLSSLLESACATTVGGWIRRVRTDPTDTTAIDALIARELDEGRPASALVLLEQRIARKPEPKPLRKLALLLWERGSQSQATKHLQTALELDPKDIKSLRLLGSWCSSQGEADAAEGYLRRVLELSPEDVASQINLGATLIRQGRPVEATRVLESAVASWPDRVEGLINLGTALSDQGRFSEARAAYQRGLRLRPSQKELISNLLFSMHFDPKVTPEALFEAHLHFAKAIEDGTTPFVHLRTKREDPLRVLHVGLVSPDFREHPVAYLLEPFLREHDPRTVTLHCYSDVRHPDRATARFRELADTFDDCTTLDDVALANRIHSDKIDILVDLAGHTAGNRLGVFARRPSPIQASWLGYFDTTGLSTIDYRLADLPSVPTFLERHFTEKVLRLPRSASSYFPPQSPAVASAPCLKRDYVTLGCFNNPAKLTEEVIGTFARILHALDGAKLILKYGAYRDPELRERYTTWFGREGIDEGRLEFRYHSSMGSYLAEFADIDLALDPFPHSGETTALHTLWMGVPLVTLEGETLVQRLGSRVLHLAGFSKWVAHTREEYVGIATALGSNRDALLPRVAIREQMKDSPLMDHRRITRDLEDAFRWMWTEYLADRKTNRPHAR